MSSKKTKAKKLSVKKESLRKLDSGKLGEVAGGAMVRDSAYCTLRCVGGGYTIECPNTGGCPTL